MPLMQTRSSQVAQKRLFEAARDQFMKLDKSWSKRFEKELAKEDSEQVTEYHRTTDSYKRRDLSMVLGTGGNGDWISDETVNEYMAYICRYGNKAAGRYRSKRSKRGVTERFVVLNIHAATALLCDQDSHYYKGPTKMTKTLTRLNCNGQLLLRPEFIFLPIRKGKDHWILGVIIPGERMIAVLDSVPYSDTSYYASIIDDMVRFELGAHYERDEDGNNHANKDWVLFDRTGPAQKNAIDCGVFMLTSAMCMIMGWGLEYTAMDIPAKRRRIAAEILSGFDLACEVAPYLQSGSHSIAGFPPNPKYPLAWTDSATDLKIYQQNLRSVGHFDEFVAENSKKLIRYVPTPPSRSARPAQSSKASVGEGASQDTPIVIPEMSTKYREFTSRRASVTPQPKSPRPRVPFLPRNLYTSAELRELQIYSEVTTQRGSATPQTMPQPQPRNTHTLGVPEIINNPVKPWSQKKRGIPKSWLSSPPKLLRVRELPSSYQSDEAFEKAVDACNHKRALSKLCRAHGWKINEYYSWGKAGVTLEEYQQRVLWEDAVLKDANERK